MICKNRANCLLATTLLLLLMALTACDQIIPPTEVVGLPQPMPRQLATVDITATSVSTLIIPPTATPTQTPSATPVPPTATATATAYAGVFMGDAGVAALPTEQINVLVDVTLIASTPLGTEPSTAEPFSNTTGGGSVSGVIPGQLVTQPAVTIEGLPPLNTGGTVATLPASQGGACTMTVDSRFASVVAAHGDLAALIGCATAPAQNISMARQPFERGAMFWWSSGEIIAQASQPFNGQPDVYWRVQDLWNESLPPDDPNMVAPDGLIQPIRGFGLAWRTQDQIRSAIGWATGQEEGYTGTIQSFERGTLFTMPNGSVLGLVTAGGTGQQYYGPF